MAHSHHEDHGHVHGAHRHGRGADRRALAIVLTLTSTFVVAEVVGGLVTGSLALLADAGHMLSDGATLVAISIWIFVEAYRRFFEPPEILGGWMLAVAALGLVVNVAGALILWRSGGESLNLQGALRHVLADLLGSVGAIAAALVILATGWWYADPIISVLIGLLVLGSSWRLVRDSIDILLEGTPPGVDAGEVGRSMAGVPGVSEVHDLHVWTITSGFPALAAHVLVGRDEDCHARRRDLEEVLAREYGIEHTTLQVDHVGDHTAVGPRLRFLSRRDRSRNPR